METKQNQAVSTTSPTTRTAAPTKPSQEPGCISDIIIPRVLVPCEEPPDVSNGILTHWSSSAHSEITARMDEILVSGGGGGDEKKCLQLKFRNVRRVCLSSAIFREFASCTVVNTKTREMGMMLMCVVEGGGEQNPERWMRYDTVCHHASLLDMQLPSAYAPLSSMYEAENAVAIEDQLVAALITDTNKERRPMGLKLGVSRMGKRQLIVSGIEHFDLGSATTRLRAVLVAEGRLDMLHTLVFNLLFQENSCTMHLYVSQVSTLNDQGDALVDLLLQHHVKSCVGHLDMQLIPFIPSVAGGHQHLPPPPNYRNCTTQVSIPNPFSIGANVCSYIAHKVFRRRTGGVNGHAARPSAQRASARGGPY